MRHLAALVVLALVLASGEPSLALRTEVAAAGLSFPVFVTAPVGDPRLFVLELGGRIRLVDEGGLRAQPFLDISQRVSVGGNGGLLGLAFDPGYPGNGLFYAWFTTGTAGLDERIVLSRFQRSADPDLADAASEEVLYEIANPNWGHNGGSIAFGPLDGYLYVMPGEGGYGIYDPDELAQDPLSPQGKVLRFDTSGGAGAPLAAAPGNPFLGSPAALDEIWALGLRNPWRWSFDRESGDLWIADVGQENREEVNLQPAGHPGGLNYGWDVMEGSACNPIDPSDAFDCTAPGPEVVLPVHEYLHGGDDCSITGGYRYRGVIPELQGRYVFGDFCSGRVATLEAPAWVETDRTAELGAPTNTLVSFGEDGFGELLQVRLSGEVLRIRSLAPDADDDFVPDAVDNCPGVANRSQADADANGVGDACEAECSDGLDNDGDGTIDGVDFGCSDPSDSSERAPELPCDDGLDNDGDGRTDYTADPDGGGDLGCFGPLWNREDPQCQDGLDNDAQPGVDFDGGASIWGAPIAAPDPQCAGKPWRDHERGGCGLGAELALVLPLLAGLRRGLLRARRGGSTRT